MAGRAVPTAIAPSRARRYRFRLLQRHRRPDAPGAMERVAPALCARQPAAWRHLRPIAKIVYGRVDEGVAPPHPSQTRMCRFPASGSSWESLAHSCVSMDDPDCRQRMALKERIEPVPLEPALAIPPRQPFAPGPCDLIGVPA